MVTIIMILSIKCTEDKAFANEIKLSFQRPNQRSQEDAQNTLELHHLFRIQSLCLKEAKNNRTERTLVPWTSRCNFQAVVIQLIPVLQAFKKSNSRSTIWMKQVYHITLVNSQCTFQSNNAKMVSLKVSTNCNNTSKKNQCSTWNRNILVLKQSNTDIVS